MSMADESSKELYVPTWFEAEAALWAQLESTLGEGLPYSHGQHLRNLRIFDTPSTVLRVLWFQHLYSLIRTVPGDIHEYGVLWGGDMVLWDNLRTINEPGMQGSLRHLVGFDTFEGHAGSSDWDGDDALVADGAYSVPEGYELWLSRHLETRRTYFHTAQAALVKGDVRETLPRYLADFPQRATALAYLDVDLYQPTLGILLEVVESMPSGGVIAFDELHNDLYPGESIAVREVLSGWGRVQRWPLASGGWCWWVKP